MTGDDLQRVRANRQRVARALGIPERWGELKQVHGPSVVALDGLDGFAAGPAVEADALVVRGREAPVAVFAADCLPIALVSEGTAAVAHAGWRGLCRGILDAALAAHPASGGPVTAWIGPSIGPCHFQVGPEVVDAFRTAYPGAPVFWEPDGNRYLFDLRAAARWILRRAGASVPEYDPPCTFCDDRFYSYRRDGETGRHAAVVWR